MANEFKLNFTLDNLYQMLQQALDSQRGINNPQPTGGIGTDPLAGIREVIKVRQQGIPKVSGVK